MNRLNLDAFPRAKIGRDVTVVCRQFHGEGSFEIGDGTHIVADRIYFGTNARIGRNVSVKAISGTTELFSLGDESLVSFDTQILVPYFRMGDYSQIFNASLVSGHKPTEIGHNCWIGQGTILNAAEDLRLGNNVRMGGSQVWTHVASGELLEGCNFYGQKPVVIEDNVWLMGFGHLVTPGVTLARNSVIMAGSVVTKSTEPFRTYSGIPARDVTDKLPAWKTFTLDDKYGMLQGFVGEFTLAFPSFSGRVLCFDPDNLEEAEMLTRGLSQKERLLIFLKAVELGHFRDAVHTLFDLNTKRYLKRRSDIEIAWFKFASGHRARFVPLNNDQWI